MTRKRRTRSHVIEDLSYNHVERHVLYCNWSTQPQADDYGIDMTIHTYDDNGEIENGYVNVQLKATDHIKFDRSGAHVLFSVEHADLQYWLAEPFPVILVRYDAIAEIGYWLDLQQYFTAIPGFNLHDIGNTVTVRIPATNIVDRQAILSFGQRKNAVLKAIGG